jgi:hypothetical protein
VGFGAIETIDITERFFENATGDSVHQDIEKMIREHMKEAKDDNNK